MNLRSKTPAAALEEMVALFDVAVKYLEATKLSKASDDVLDERQRQISEEGWTPELDDGYSCDELAMAAACYALPCSRRRHYPFSAAAPEGWPWANEWWRPTPNDRRRELVKAAALLIAEIERLDRATQEKPE